MTSTGRRRIGPVDTIWLNMDRPNNLMVIVSLMFLESVPVWEDVEEVIRGGIIERYPVFSQRPAAPPVPGWLPSWEDDPDFSLDNHLHRVTLPAPGDDAALRQYVDERIPVPLDRAHPLWEVYLIEGYGAGAVLFCRFHHALADGIALARVLLSMTEDEAGAPRPARGVEVGRSHDHSLVRNVVWGAVALAREGLGQASRLAHPSGVLEALGLGVRTSSVAAEVLLAHNSDNVFSGSPGLAKRVVWTRAFPLADLKAAGRQADATLNDVLLSAVAGALRTYQREHGAEPVDLVTMVPVNVRPVDKPLPRELGNQFAILFFKFPCETPTLPGRLAETKRRMDWLKSSPEAILTYELISAIGRTTGDLERNLVNFFANKAIGVTTNVAGPTSMRTLAGVPMTSVLGWVPGSGEQTVGVCIFTYVGTVRVGFMVDAKVIPDPQALLRAFEEEVTGLVHEGARSASR